MILLVVEFLLKFLLATIVSWVAYLWIEDVKMRRRLSWTKFVPSPPILGSALDIKNTLGKPKSLKITLRNLFIFSYFRHSSGFRQIFIRFEFKCCHNVIIKSLLFRIERLQIHGIRFGLTKNPEQVKRLRFFGKLAWNWFVDRQRTKMEAKT